MGLGYSTKSYSLRVVVIAVLVLAAASCGRENGPSDASASGGEGSTSSMTTAGPTSPSIGVVSCDELVGQLAASNPPTGGCLMHDGKLAVLTTFVCNGRSLITYADAVGGFVGEKMSSPAPAPSPTGCVQDNPG